MCVLFSDAPLYFIFRCSHLANCIIVVECHHRSIKLWYGCTPPQPPTFCSRTLCVLGVVISHIPSTLQQKMSLFICSMQPCMFRRAKCRYSRSIEVNWERNTPLLQFAHFSNNPTCSRRSAGSPETKAITIANRVVRAHIQRRGCEMIALRRDV